MIAFRPVLRLDIRILSIHDITHKLTGMKRDSKFKQEAAENAFSSEFKIKNTMKLYRWFEFCLSFY